MISLWNVDYQLFACGMMKLRDEIHRCKNIKIKYQNEIGSKFDKRNVSVEMT